MADFYDHVKIYVKAGNGGNGSIAFHREKYISHGGPSGGDGGNGGNIVFVIDEGKNTLLDFRTRKKFVAQNGGDGGTEKFHGANAPDLIIPVPDGTVIKDAKTGRLIKDMSRCEPFTVARGGKGGWGNTHFATPTRQAPRFAKNGLDGEEFELSLELKMLADVGFVGMPNVGKSTLLSVISAARPKIANYHFTTLTPMLGVVNVHEGSGFIAADIPGLIEGASDGAGLGFDFLRHVSRCRLLVHVVDIAGSEGRDPIEDMKMINEELRLYSEELASRPQIIAANKCDILDRENANVKAFEDYAASLGFPVIYISAASGENVKTLCEEVYKKLQSLPPITIYEPEPEEVPAEPDNPTDITYEKKNGIWYIEGEWLKWMMSGINFSDRESLNYFGRMLRQHGLIDKMREIGIVDGDEVHIYDIEFDFVE
ncbi:MAG: GTPase ObgE [Clostridiales bacterium]|nr:GTPase ObgE [Clostridiales bacterium]